MKKLIVFVVILGGARHRRLGLLPEPHRPGADGDDACRSRRGDVVERVQATGTLEAVTTVDVGTQVSGVVQDLYADFNDIVKKGQVIARLDPSILQVQIESQQANVIRAEADLERLRVTLDGREAEARARAGDVRRRSWCRETDLEAAEIAVKSAEAQIKSSEASLTQTKAQPESGAGQPRLHRHHLAHRRHRDLAQRRSGPDRRLEHERADALRHRRRPDQDAGRREHRRVRRRPHAARTDGRRSASTPTPPTRSSARSQQVRLQPTVVQNVVVYSTVIAVPNPQLKLKPGMTATRRASRSRAGTTCCACRPRRVRFRPTEAMFAVLNQPVPPEAAARRRRLRWRPWARGRTRTRRRPAARADLAPDAGAHRQARTAAGAPQATRSRPHRRAAGAGGRSPPAAAGVRTSAEARGGGDRMAAIRGGGEGGGRGVGGGRGFDPNMTPGGTPQADGRAHGEHDARGARAHAGAHEGARGAGRRRGGPAAAGGGQRARRRTRRPGGGRNATAAAGAARDPSRGIAGSVTAAPSIASGATTIDSLFAPLQTTETRGRAWLYENKQLKSVSAPPRRHRRHLQRVIEGDLKEGQEVVVNMLTGLEPVNRPGQPARR